MKRHSKKFILALLLAPAIASAAEVTDPSPQAQLSLDDLRTFTDVFNQVRKNFVEETDDHKLLNAAIRGMLSELDPHSSFMDADELRKMDNDFQWSLQRYWC